MLKKIRAVGYLCSFTFALSACENLPPGAYSLTSDSLPARAKAVDATAYGDLQKTGRFYSISYQSIGLQLQQSQDADKENTRILENALRANPRLASHMPVAPSEPLVTHNPNDTYGHWVHLNDNRSNWVVTHGLQWNRATLRYTLENYPKRENQVQIYRMFHAALSDSARRSLELPEPDALAADPQNYSPAQIEALNNAMANELAQFSGTVPSAISQAAAPACSGADEGSSASGSDHAGNNDSDPACGTQSGGIYAHYDWASKPYLTCVKDQARRGTCVAFSTASAIENLVARNLGKHVNISEQDLYQRGRMVGFRDDYNEGLVDWLVLSSMINDHWKIPAETFWEYNPSYSRQENKSAHLYTQSCDGYTTEDCSDSSHQMQVFCNDQGKYRYCGFLAKEASSTGYGVTGTSQLWNLLDTSGSLNRVIAAAKTGQPVILAFNVTPSWDGASRQGFITYNGSGEKNRGGHAVHVVGAIDNTTLAQVLPSAPATDPAPAEPSVDLGQANEKLSGLLGGRKS